MQIKIYFSFCLLLLFFFYKGYSQPITYTETVNHSLCSGSDNGSITINVTSTNGPYTFQWSSGGTTNTETNLAPGSYSVTITDNSSNSTTANFTIIELECNFKAELYFTPNGDDYNDYWSIAGLTDFPNSLVIVYNRMGQKVFESKDGYEPWDGKDLLGRPLPDGVYFYIIYANKKNKKPAEKGSVTILR